MIEYGMKKSRLWRCSRILLYKQHMYNEQTNMIDLVELVQQ